jgi:hypothetical protein
MTIVEGIDSTGNIEIFNRTLGRRKIPLSDVGYELKKTKKGEVYYLK